MCGIFASNDPRVGQGDLAQINARLKFRGPDRQSDLVQFSDWKLYHSRLSIIAPTEEFSQPYRSSAGDIIVFNGEILNFRELVAKYQLPEISSDTAALLALLELEDFDLSEVDGFFAFLRIDRHGKLTHCARDRFGVKPLFIHRNGEFITVSSEASIISDLYDLPFSDAALEEYRVFRAPVFAGTYFDKIDVVAPGTCIVTGTYFDPLTDFTGDYEIAEELQTVLEETIRATIRSRMIADVPVGLLFSGGIDSNLLSSLAETGLQRFTGGFLGDYDLEFVRDCLVDKSQHDTTLIEVTDEDFRERFRDMIRLRKEPLSVPNEVILSFLAGAWAERGGKVLISGEAADEFFAGYDRIFRWAAQAKEFDVERFIDLYCYIPRAQISDRILSVVNDFFAPLTKLTPFEKVRYFFVKKHLPVLFRRLDFALMYSGIEGREPLASYSIFKLALRFGPENLFCGELGKLPLRILAEEKFSYDFAFSPKVGFPVDLGRIFRGMPSTDKFNNYETWCKENMEALK